MHKSYFVLFFCNLKLWPLVTEEQTTTKEGAVPSEEYWRQLCEKHLPAFKSDAVLPDVSQASSFTVNEDALVLAQKSLSCPCVHFYLKVNYVSVFTKTACTWCKLAWYLFSLWPPDVALLLLINPQLLQLADYLHHINSPKFESSDIWHWSRLGGCLSSSAYNRSFNAYSARQLHHCSCWENLFAECTVDAASPCQTDWRNAGNSCIPGTFRLWQYSSCSVYTSSPVSVYWSCVNAYESVCGYVLCLSTVYQRFQTIWLNSDIDHPVVVPREPRIPLESANWCFL